MQAAPANISASPRQAPGGETDRLAPKAVATPPMASTRPTLAEGQALDPEKGSDQHGDQGRGREGQRAPCSGRVDQRGVEQDGEKAKEEQAEANPGRPIATTWPPLAFDEGKWEEQQRAAPKAQEPNGDRVSRSGQKAGGHDGGPAQSSRENGGQNA